MKTKKNYLYTGVKCLILAWLFNAQLTPLEALPSDTPKISMDSAGNVVAVWEAFSLNNTYVVQTASFTALSSTWSSTTTLSSDTNSATLPSIAVNSDGNAVAIWLVNDPTTGYNIVQASILPAGGSWSTAQFISNTDGTESPFNDYQVRISGSNLIVATWTAYLNGNSVIRSATATVSGGWNAPVTVSSP